MKNNGYYYLIMYIGIESVNMEFALWQIVLSSYSVEWNTRITNGISNPLVTTSVIECVVLCKTLPFCTAANYKNTICNFFGMGFVSLV